MRKSLLLPLPLLAFAVACSQGSAALTDEMRRDLESARAETPELATRAHSLQEVVSARELAPMGVPTPAQAPRRSTTPTRRAPVPTPAPVANASESGTVAAAEEVAVAPATTEPAPTQAEAPAPDIVVAERPTAPPMVIPGDGGGMRGGRGSGGGGGGVVVVIRGGRGDVDHCPPPGRRGRRGGGIIIGRDNGVLINDRLPRSRGPSITIGGGSIGVGFP